MSTRQGQGAVECIMGAQRPKVYPVSLLPGLQVNIRDPRSPLNTPLADSNCTDHVQCVSLLCAELSSGQLARKIAKQNVF